MDDEQGVKSNQTPKSRISRKSVPITGLVVDIPESLQTAILVMRRNPADFTITDKAKCKLCYKRNAFDLSHELNPNAGTWCPEHGWLHFASNQIRPTGEEYIPRKRHIQRAK